MGLLYIVRAYSLAYSWGHTQTSQPVHSTLFKQSILHCSETYSKYVLEHAKEYSW